ncbi:MAG: hypothetical protein K6T31_00960 [Alicyclobacillus sp.]|nr:hypothetical protein [Alicyclobacillus sp.]
MSEPMEEQPRMIDSAAVPDWVLHGRRVVGGVAGCVCWISAAGGSLFLG